MLELIKNAIKERKAKKNETEKELTFGRAFMLAFCDIKQLSDEINDLTKEMEEEN